MNSFLNMIHTLDISVDLKMLRNQQGQRIVDEIKKQR